MDKTRRELKANLQRLHALALKTDVPGATQKLAQINQRLAVYSETSEVAKILMEMLDDIEQRLKIIDTVDEQAKQLVEDTEAKMVCVCKIPRRLRIGRLPCGVAHVCALSPL